MTTSPDDAARLPKTYLDFRARFPELAAAHASAGIAAKQAGPLDEKMCELVKIGICVGAGLESALKSHVRRATEAGATPTEIEHAIVQAMTTCGFSRTVSAWRWAMIQFERDAADASGRSPSKLSETSSS